MGVPATCDGGKEGVNQRLGVPHGQIDNATGRKNDGKIFHNVVVIKVKLKLQVDDRRDAGGQSSARHQRRGGHG